MKSALIRVLGKPRGRERLAVMYQAGAGWRFDTAVRRLGDWTLVWGGRLGLKAVAQEDKGIPRATTLERVWPITSVFEGRAALMPKAYSRSSWWSASNTRSSNGVSVSLSLSRVAKRMSNASTTIHSADRALSRTVREFMTVPGQIGRDRARCVLLFAIDHARNVDAILLNTSLRSS